MNIEDILKEIRISSLFNNEASFVHFFANELSSILQKRGCSEIKMYFEYSFTDGTEGKRIDLVVSFHFADDFKLLLFELKYIFEGSKKLISVSRIPGTIFPLSYNSSYDNSLTPSEILKDISSLKKALGYIRGWTSKYSEKDSWVQAFQVTLTNKMEIVDCLKKEKFSLISLPLQVIDDWRDEDFDSLALDDLLIYVNKFQRKHNLEKETWQERKIFTRGVELLRNAGFIRNDMDDSGLNELSSENNFNLNDLREIAGCVRNFVESKSYKQPDVFNFDLLWKRVEFKD